MSAGLLPPRPPGVLGALAVLLGKELLRLRRNPAALMAVGLLVLMSVLVSLETRGDPARQRAAGLPCWIVHAPGDPFAAYLQRHAGPRLPVAFLAREQPQASAYPRGLPCAAEIGPVQDRQAQGLKPLRRIVFRHGEDRARSEQLARWVLSGLAAQALDAKIEQGLQPFPAGHVLAPPGGLARLDLGSGQTRALVGTMLLYSAQFFVACALFISFAAHERERGIAQALALSPVGPGLALLAKFIFHLGLAAAACALMLAVLAPRLLGSGLLWGLLLLMGLGLSAVATLVVSFSRSQTAASLLGFCYLMTVGAVFALSGSFPAFQGLRLLMFEHHALQGLGALLGPRGPETASRLLDSLLGLGLTVPPLLLAATLAWRRRGWRQG
ncbi:ABC transporter permease [Aquariibacter albus]|uniref:ABC transporter permease n=1 Tax=Aquariibacter albus TaxID=2759899 RepID=A0A839HU67_9BURK|nr:ABC transporter permease [Aquariibacter albus]MBB1163001.1 ABC transporter permease [Aquariibacter albus]